MTISMSLSQLRALMVDAAEVGAKRALSEVGNLKPHMTKQEAYKIYGESNVRRWIKEELLHPVRDSTGTTRWRISRHELEAVAKAANRHTFLNTNER